LFKEGKKRGPPNRGRKKPNNWEPKKKVGSFGSITSGGFFGGGFVEQTQKWGWVGVVGGVKKGENALVGCKKCTTNTAQKPLKITKYKKKNQTGGGGKKKKTKKKNKLGGAPPNKPQVKNSCWVGNNKGPNQG